jgi:hypothetical protein
MYVSVCLLWFVSLVSSSKYFESDGDGDGDGVCCIVGWMDG